MRKTIKFLDRNISYTISGEGKTVMLVHGFGETGEVWRPQTNHLQNQFRVIVPDLPGSGMSELLPQTSMDSMADCLQAICDEEKLEDYALIGHSMGGYVALAFAEKYPEKLKALGLFHSTAAPDSAEKIPTRKKGIQFIKAHGAFEFLKTSVPKLFAPETNRDRPELADKFLSSLNNFLGESLVYYYEAMISRPDRLHLLKNSKIPVLIILGKHDTAIPFEDGLKLCPLPGIAYIHVLHHSGHMGMMEEPNKSNRILEEFLIDSLPANP